MTGGGRDATTVTAADFRALARSSPWLWRTLQFTLVHDGPVYPGEPIRAYVGRPHGVRVERLDGRLVQSDWCRAPGAGLPALDGDPTFRADGLVARRPGSWDVPERFDDPMFQTYRWVAMLHPFELADGVSSDDEGGWSPLWPPIEVVDGPREVDHHGRPAWEAQLVTTPAYAARCSCCPLLDGAQAARRLAETDGVIGRPGDRPIAWLIRLDRGTGVVVALTEIGGSSHSGGWSMTIEAVDGELPRELFRPGHG
ncbi:MAG: hypothetical protein ABJA16_10720 [Nakamurella sp.]